MPFQNCNLKIDSFEPFPELSSIIEEKFSNFGSILSLHKAAVDTVDDKKKFYLQDYGARTGSSIYKSKESTYQQMWLSGDIVYKDKETGEVHKIEFEWDDPTRTDPPPKPLLVLHPDTVNEIVHAYDWSPKLNLEDLLNWIEVDTVNIVKWLESSVDSENEIVILKLDVEGSEYGIVNKLLQNGLGKLVDVLLVEWTPEEKIVSCKEIYGTIEDRHNLKFKVNEKIKLVLDWHYPETCTGPLQKYLKNILQ